MCLVLWLLAWLAAAMGLLLLGAMPGNLEASLFGEEGLCGTWG